MRTSSPRASGSALLAAVLLAGCGGPAWRIEAPPTFKRFEQTSDFRYITADGVMLQGREVKNYPTADLPFWTDALQRHLEARGYTFQEKDCFETRRGQPGCTLDFLLPWGAEDWLLSVTLFVAGPRILLLESAGPFERFEPVKASLRAAYRTFEPGD